MSADLTPLIPVIQQANADLLAYATQVAQLQATNGTLTGQLGQATKATADAIAALAKAQAQIKKFVVPGSNLSQLLTQANPGQAFVIDSRFDLPYTLISKPNISLICLPGASLNFQPISTTGIEVAAPGFTVSGPALTGPSDNKGKPYTVAFHLKAGATDFHLSDCTVADGQLQNLCNIDAGADRAQIIRNTVGLTSGCVVFCSADDLLVAILNAAGSTDEHVIRFDTGMFPDKTLHRPQNARIIGGTMSNTDGKEVIACREIDFVTIANIITNNGWFDFGQSSGDSNIHCSHVRLIDIRVAQNARIDPKTGLHAQIFNINHDVDLVAIDVQAGGNADAPAFIVGPRSKLALVGGKQLVPAGVTAKPLAKVSDPSGTIVGLETVTQVAA